MKTELILIILSIVCTLAAVLISYYLYIKKLIETGAIDAINKAENTDLIAHEKMVEAVETIYAVLPVVVRPFVSKIVIETIIQSVFNKMEEYAAKQVEKNKETDDAAM